MKYRKIAIQKDKSKIKYCCHFQDNNMILKEKLEKIINDEGHKNYRADQVLKSIYKKGILDFEKILEIPSELRVILKKKLIISSLSIESLKSSVNGSAVKYLFKTKDKNTLETVLLKFKDKRNTVCVSTQIGCKLGCKFCATGKYGFKRDLSYEEIFDQVLMINHELINQNKKLTNVVYMGMGEPFMNYENVVNSIKYLKSPDYLNIGSRNITVSTAGIPDKIREIAQDLPQVNLAISLHAPNQTTREKIMPIAKLYPITDLFSAVDYYNSKTNRRITYEYIMLKKINDSIKDAKELASLLKDKLCHVNLIPYNTIENTEIESSEREKIDNFKNELISSGINATVRVSLGQDIAGACGQLANK